MEWERRHKSTDYYPCQCVKLSAQFHAAAKLPPVYIGQKDVWSPVPVCFICGRNDSLVTAGIRTTNPHHAVQSLY